MQYTMRIHLGLDRAIRPGDHISFDDVEWNLGSKRATVAAVAYRDGDVKYIAFSMPGRMAAASETSDSDYVPASVQVVQVVRRLAYPAEFTVEELIAVPVRPLNMARLSSADQLPI